MIGVIPRERFALTGEVFPDLKSEVDRADALTRVCGELAGRLMRTRRGGNAVHRVNPES